MPPTCRKKTPVSISACVSWYSQHFDFDRAREAVSNPWLIILSTQGLLQSCQSDYWRRTCGQHHNVISMRPSQIISREKTTEIFFSFFSNLFIFWAWVTELITARTIWPFCKNTSYKDPSLIPSLLRLSERLRSLRLALSLASGCSWWFSSQQTGFILLFSLSRSDFNCRSIAESCLELYRGPTK